MSEELQNQQAEVERVEDQQENSQPSQAIAAAEPGAERVEAVAPCRGGGQVDLSSSKRFFAI